MSENRAYSGQSDFGIKLADALGISKDAAAGLPLISMIGNCEICVENFKALMEYELCRIRVLTRRGVICINGSCLEILYMNTEEIVVKGRIESVCFEGRP